MPRQSLRRTSLTILPAIVIVLGTGSPAFTQRVQRAAPNRTGNTTVVRPLAVTGTVTAISTTAGTLTITPAGQANNQAVNLTVTSSTAISIDGTTGQSLANLVAGMSAVAVYQAAGGINTALQIRASSKVLIAGTITAISPDGSTLTITPSGNNASPATVTVSSGTSVCLNGSKGQNTSSLVPGMQVKLDCQLGSTGTSATQIQASDKLHVRGTITAVALATGSTTSGVVTITPANGNAVSLNVDLNNGTTVTFNGTAVTSLNGLAVGMRAEARYQVTSSGNNASVLKVRSN